MLKPVPMTRVLVVGPSDRLEETIERLHALKLLHIVDHREGEAGLPIGKPLEKATAASEELVKLRSISSVLQIDEKTAPDEAEAIGDVRGKILSLELNISEEDAARKKTQALIADLTRRIEELTPFAQVPLLLQDYRGYESLEVFVGKTAREVTGLERVATEYETFSAPGFLAVFVSREQAPAVRERLVQQGFSSLAVPEGDGDPRAILAELNTEKERWERRLEEIEERLGKLRQRYAGFLVAAKAHLEVQVEKAEAPLRFAATEHSFVVEGWIPEERVNDLGDSLRAIPDLFFDELETEEHSGEPPVLLRNPKPSKPFEMLVKLVSIPSYREIDPTFSVVLIFPVFFGLMIGDAGYGLTWLIFGGLLLRRLKPGGLRNLVITLIWGGVFSILFGLFLFGDIYGIPFHHPPAEAGIDPRIAAINWSDIIGLEIPYRPPIEKLYQVTDFLGLALLAAYLHLTLGYGIGLADEIRHSRKHALGKFAWILILLGMYVLILVRTALYPGMGRTIWDTVFAWFPRGDPLGLFPPDLLIQAQLGFTAANPIPAVALYLLIVGIPLLVITEGSLHIMEVFGLLANLVSYGRLAAVGVAKAAMALAFNIIIFTSFFFVYQDTGNVGYLIGGIALLVLLQAIVFLLGAISAYIQSIRLHYVEFFQKFFKGNGTEFRPFGVKAKPEV